MGAAGRCPPPAGAPGVVFAVEPTGSHRRGLRLFLTESRAAGGRGGARHAVSAQGRERLAGTRSRSRSTSTMSVWGKCRAIPEIATSQGFLRSWPAHPAILSVEAFTQRQLQQRPCRTVAAQPAPPSNDAEPPTTTSTCESWVRAASTARTSADHGPPR
jgi:hypothetical protein